MTLNLDPQQVKQAETQKIAANSAVTARVPETYQWLLVPVQATPQAAVEWQAIRLSGQDALAVRASKKLRNEELLVTTLAGTRLRMELDRVPLWRGDHVPIKRLAEDFARYPYLPRLNDADVLMGAVRDGLGLLLWSRESFASADSYDETACRYRGLRCGPPVAGSLDNMEGLLVKPDVALNQQKTEPARGPTVGPLTEPGRPGGDPSGATERTSASLPKRFHGTVALDPTRVGRDAGRIADEVIAHVASLVGSRSL